MISVRGGLGAVLELVEEDLPRFHACGGGQRSGTSSGAVDEGPDGHEILAIDTARTARRSSVTSAWVRPDAVTNSASRPSEPYSCTSTPRSPLRRLRSGRSRSRTTVSSSLNPMGYHPEMRSGIGDLLVGQDDPRCQKFGLPASKPLEITTNPHTSLWNRWPLPELHSLSRPDTGRPGMLPRACSGVAQRGEERCVNSTDQMLRRRCATLKMGAGRYGAGHKRPVSVMKGGLRVMRGRFRSRSAGR